jgi:hypothetical protein
MSAVTTYDPGYINRRRRTKAEVEQLDRQIFDVLDDDHPQSIRHVFYRMTDPRLDEPVPKTDTGSPNGYRMVWHRLKELRRSGDVPYHWITDATRRGYHVATYPNGADFLRAHAAAYRAPIWAQAGVYVEVWAESRSIAGVVEDDCEDLAVSLYPAGGFSSITLAYEAAEQIADEIGDSGKPAHVVYIGDYDPAGVLIDRSIEAELRRDLPDEIDLTFHRLAITEAQIVGYDLPTKPRKPGDKRALHVRETVEAEAMPAGILRRLLRDKIEAFLPFGALEVVKAAEESERAGLETWARLMDSSARKATRKPLPYIQDFRTQLVPYIRAIEELARPDWDNKELIHDLADHWPWDPRMILEASLLVWAIHEERKRLDGVAP